ncbi:ribosome silencing factor [Bacteroides sp. Phil13]|uniref:ribosome silencing factor n=1 Tax=Bacteroides sp. Phil13 TaxID=1929999 RepID=UPI000A8A6248|nr:ribosome silencing factor [Bacteroides sp. Phil13]
MIQSKEMAKIVYNALEDKKAEDIVVLEVSDITILADYFVIANGTNSSQVHALVDSVEEQLSKVNVEPKRVEGVGNTNWILMDYGDIVIHIFSKEDRLFYDLERIWRDGKKVSKEDL